eukprot:7789827-Alexandrium_andersonii.AAC.1
MSASLVGSEMCIRDSIGTCRDAPHAFWPRGNRRSGPRVSSLRHALAPVSYTHLTLPTICSV